MFVTRKRFDREIKRLNDKIANLSFLETECGLLGKHRDDSLARSLVNAERERTLELEHQFHMLLDRLGYELVDPKRAGGTSTGVELRAKRAR